MKKVLCSKYQVLKPIAEGGMGCVYLIKDLHLNKLAVVKISKAVFERSMLQEREVLKKLSHPALPRITDFFEEEGNSCLVMEYVEGITLEQHLRKFGRVEVKQAVKWAVELSEVLDYLHHQNPPVIYRDLKPANIMIQPNGRLKLIDFGTASVSAFGREKEDFLMGTPGYSAPEQWKSNAVGKGSDIYALGAILHEMLTGIRPRQPFTERRPVREYDRSIPGKLERIVMVCTKEDPKERYQSMTQVKQALLSYRKTDLGSRLLYGLQRGCGISLWLAAGIKTVFPLFLGVREDLFPFPFLKEPLLLLGAAWLYQHFITGKQRKRGFLKKQEKSIFLTEKKFSGWYVAGILLFLLLQTVMVGKEITAAESHKELWVEMRDEQNRKLLLKKDAVYEPEQRVRLDIPCERLPEGPLCLQVLAVDEEGEIYESRVFLVERKQEKEE